MACVDVNLFHSYIGAVMPVFTRSHASEHSDSSLLSCHGAAIVDLRFRADLWFLGIIHLNRGRLS